MQIGRLKKDFRWNFGIGFGTEIGYKHGFFPWINVWCFKLKTIPSEGEAFNKNNYIGFYWFYDIFAHWIITVRVRYLKWFYVTYPISIKHIKQ